MSRVLSTNSSSYYKRRILKPQKKSVGGCSPQFRNASKFTMKMQKVTAYGLFNMLSWLAKSDPNCELVPVLLDKIKEEHPTFGESTHPDLDHWIGGIGSGAADGSDDFTNCNLNQLLETLETAKDGFYPEVNTKGRVIRSIGRSVQQSHEWGISIAREAQQASVWLTEALATIARCLGCDRSDRGGMGI